MTSAAPGPIPIVRSGESPNNVMSDGTPLARGSNSGSYLGLGTSFSGNSFKDAMALSYGKDVADLLEYTMGRFSSSTDSDVTVAGPSSVRLESTFCRNFTCCGRKLDDLHDLLQHYEECHVRFEGDDVASMMTDEELETSSLASDAETEKSYQSTSSVSSTLNKTAPDEAMKRKLTLQGTARGTPMVNTTQENLENPSAFETTVMRSPSANRGTKRSLGQPLGGNGSTQLFRAVIENGGRHPLGMSNAFASPFSSPGNSRPGTPSVESENEAFFGSTTQASMFSNLSLRNSTIDDQQPSCAPPNLFFPSGASSQRPSKRERFNANQGASTTTAAGNGVSVSSAAASDSNSSEHRPYKCPAPGCDKAYKQMNGLKYHRVHGHCNQNLRNINTNTPTSADVTSTPIQQASSTLQSPVKPQISTQIPTASSEKESTPISETAALNNLSSFKPFAGIAAADSPVSTQEAPSTPTKQNNAQPEKTYVCQVGNCDKRYKNLNGLRYHYLHSGSHGLLGLQLLHANGGGASAKADSVSGRPPVSTDTLSREQIVQAAAAAQALLNQQQQQNGANIVKNQGNTNSNLSAAAFLASVSNGSYSVTGATNPM